MGSHGEILGGRTTPGAVTVSSAVSQADQLSVTGVSAHLTTTSASAPSWTPIVALDRVVCTNTVACGVCIYIYIYINELVVDVLYAAFETCFGWDPRHQRVLRSDSKNTSQVQMLCRLYIQSVLDWSGNDASGQGVLGIYI